MSRFRNKKPFLILYSLIYIALTAAIVASSVSIFNNFYYEMVYVSGSSMSPTLSGDVNDADYAKTDKTYGAKKALKRFQIVTTYYKSDLDENGKIREGSVYKIKRVIALPGEYYKVENDQLYIKKTEEASWGDPLVLTYEPNIPYGGDGLYRSGKLNVDEYFLAGDNGPSSFDSFDVGPINFNLIVGVITSVEGRCKVDNKKIVEKRPYASPLYFLGVDY